MFRLEVKFLKMLTSGYGQNFPKVKNLTYRGKKNTGYQVWMHGILEPAPQGMGAPQATENTQGNDAETHSSLPG